MNKNIKNDKILKFGVIGLGNIGARHLAVIDAQQNARIVGICDIEKERCRSFSKMYKNVPYFLDYMDMLEQTDIDVLNICTPHHLHASMAIDAANAGKHVLVEKPMALTVSDCKRMMDTAKKKNVRLMVVKQNRYNIPVILAQKALINGLLGRIFIVQCNVLWNRNDEYYSESNWRGRKIFEGGALFTQVSHFIDLLIWWFGDVIQAKSKITTINHKIEIEDFGTTTVQFNSGVVGLLCWTTCVYEKNYEGSITIIGEKGIIKIGGQYLNKIEHWNIQDYPLPENIKYVDKPNSYGKYQGTSSNHDKVIHDVILDILFNKKTVVQGDEGIKSIEAIEMIYRNC